MRMRGWLLVIALMPLLGSADSQRELTPHSAEYKVSISGISGRLTTTLSETDSGDFSATHEVRATGFARLIVGKSRIREQSRFTIDDARILPLEYESVDEISREKGRIALQYDHTESTLTGTIAPEDGEPVAIDQELVEGLFDRVSVQYQLMLDLQANSPDSADQAPVIYAIFDPDGNKTLDVTRLGERDIRVGRKTYTALGVRHQSPGSSRRTELWLAPDLDYVPVLIEQYKKDKRRLRATLRSYAAGD